MSLTDCYSAWWGQSFVTELNRISIQADKKMKSKDRTQSTLSESMHNVPTPMAGPDNGLSYQDINVDPQ